MSIEHDIFGIATRVGINSKNKGDRNEREAAKWLQRWVGVKFTRTPSSGGLRWKNNPSVCGDVTCEDHTFNFPFTVETKHLKNIPFSSNLRSNSIVYTILEQCEQDCMRSGKEPMLLLRKNGMIKGNYIVYFKLAVAALLVGIAPISKGDELYGYDSEDLLTVSFEELMDRLIL